MELGSKTAPGGWDKVQVPAQQTQNAIYSLLSINGTAMTIEYSCVSLWGGEQRVFNKMGTSYRIRKRRYVWEGQREEAYLSRVSTYLDAASSSYLRRSSSSSVCVAFNAGKK